MVSGLCFPVCDFLALVLGLPHRAQAHGGRSSLPGSAAPFMHCFSITTRVNYFAVRSERNFLEREIEQFTAEIQRL